MKQFIKDIAANIGFTVPYICLLAFSNPALFKQLDSWHIIILGIVLAICKELFVWGLKKD